MERSANHSLNSMGRSGIALLFVLGNVWLAGFAHSQTIALSGDAAFLNFSVFPADALETYLRFDAEGLTTERVTALTWEIQGLPSGLTLSADAAGPPCVPAVEVSWEGGTGPGVMVFGIADATGGDGEPECAPYEVEGDEPVLTFTLSTEARNEVTQALFPLRTSITVDANRHVTSFSPISIVYRYQLDDGEEVTNAGAPLEITPVEITIDDYYCVSVQGDADLNGNITPNDAQLVFEHFLGASEANVSCAQCDEEDTTSITPGDAQAIFDVFIGQRAQCDGWDFERVSFRSVPFERD